MIGKLHKAESILFRCTKIRKSKSAWVMLRWSDVYVLNAPSMGLKTFAAVHGSKTLDMNRQTKIY